MNKPKLKLICVYLAAFFLGVMLLAVSQRVQQAESRLSALDRALLEEVHSLRVLRTEWAFLNNPERLEFFAREHLGLQPPDPAAILGGFEARSPDDPAAALYPAHVEEGRQ